MKRVDGQTFVNGWDIYHNGHRDMLLPTDLIRLRGYVYEVLGRADDREWYWIRQFNTELQLPVTEDASNS